MQQWKFKGRIAVKNERENVTATLLWNQQDANYELRFIAPLGQGTYILKGSDSGVMMQAPKDKTYYADSPEELIKRSLGWDVHMAGLRYWIRGIPEPGITYSELLLDDKGRLTNMEQSGFNVSIARYSDESDVSLPQKLTIKSDKIRLKLVIQSWEI